MARRTTKAWKTCKCGRSFTKAEWAALKLCGPQVYETVKLIITLELRHCPCRSTIAVEYRTKKTGTSLR